MRKLVFKVSEVDQRIDKFLRSRLSGYFGEELSTTNVKDLMENNNVYLNEKRCGICSKRLKANARITVFWGKPKIQLKDWSQCILYEDKDFIVVSKPAGMASQSTLKKKETNMYDELSYFLTTKNFDRLAYCGLVHRLDKDTSGVMVFTKSTLGNRSLSRQFLQHRVKKEYLAKVVTKDPLPLEFEVNTPLKRVRSGQGYKSEAHESGKPAHTKFSIQSQLTPQEYLLRAHPITGRMHQIRAHLAQLQAPIHGDHIYGSVVQGPLKLHAHKLSFYHPQLKTVITSEAPPPQGF